MDAGFAVRTAEGTVVRPPTSVEPVWRRAEQIHRMRCVWRVRRFAMPGMRWRSEGCGISCGVTVAQ